MKRVVLFLACVLLGATAQAENRHGSFSDEQICIAGIATNNGRSAKGIRVPAKQGDIITVAYTRDDGRIFGYSCRITADEIWWRDQSMSQWNKNTKLYYSLSNEGARLKIRSVVFGEEMTKSYTLADF